MTPNPDIVTLFATRFVRLFAYGFLSVILAFHLASVGLDETEIGLLFTFTLLGDAVVSLWMTTSADRVSRRRMLILGAALMAASGFVFALTSNIVLLGAAAIIGVISPSGKEIGPFLSIEQAALWSYPFFIAGGVKIIYDLLLYNSFRKLKPVEETSTP